MSKNSNGKRRILFFSVLFFLIMTAGESAVFLVSMRQMAYSYIQEHLNLLIETRRMRLLERIDREIHLTLKLANSPLIKHFFLQPEHPILRPLAIEEILAYQGVFAENIISWISDVDQKFYNGDQYFVTYDPLEPLHAWYKKTLSQEDPFNLNIDFDYLFRKQYDLYINAPVRDQGKGVGVVCNRITLSDFIDDIFNENPRPEEQGVLTHKAQHMSFSFFSSRNEIRCYLFNSDGIMTVAPNIDLVNNKTNIIEYWGDKGEKILDQARKLKPGESRQSSDGNVQYMVSAVPELNWYITAFIPINFSMLIDTPMTTVFVTMMAVIFLVFLIFDALIIKILVDLIQSKSAIEAAARAKSAFLANMSHEIRTPMNVIIGMSDLMPTDNLTELQRGYFKDIKIMSKSLLIIVNDILDFSKIEAGKLDLIPVHYSVWNLFDHICSINRFSFKEKEIEFRYSRSQNVPEFLYGDEIRVRQIFINIVNNAMKYTVKGFVDFSLKTGERNGKEYLIGVVKDTGIGIKKEDLPKIFQSFERVDVERNRAVAGTGLGLAVTKRLLDLMDGSIEVASVYGQGSTFTVSIPLVRGNPTKTKETFIKPLAKIAAARILVVDDLPINLAVAQGFLSKYGVQADAALSGAEALDKIKQAADSGAPYDLIFMDHLMPEMDGIETTQRIRKMEKSGLIVNNRDAPTHTSIVALSANVVSGARERFLSAGMQDFISKPIDEEELNSVLVRWLEAKQDPVEVIEKPQDIDSKQEIPLSLPAPQKTKHLFIINPKSFPRKEDLDELIAAIKSHFIQKQGMNVEYLDEAAAEFSINISRFPRHAIIIIGKYIQNIDPDTRVRVYSVGGEGNNFCCLNGIIWLSDTRNTELALMPYGTTNDFVLLFGKEHIEDFRSTALQASAPVVPVDVIKCNNNYALNNCTVGLEAAAVIKTISLNLRFENLRHRFHGLSAFFYTLGGALSLFNKKLLCQQYTVIADGEDLSGTYVSINIANGPFYGGGKKPVPDAIPNDGFLNIVMLRKTKDITPLRILTLITRHFKGEQAKFPEYFLCRRFKKIRISSNSPLYVNMDGEAFFDSELNISVVPHAVKIAAVKGLPFNIPNEKRSAR
ncbi:MAG: response regulator [Treponema sp.]|jgi:signal transduction histidine kinase/diacylglycerol kinase family enzyme/DNA-binding NarL/FixJ family response regulator|nr:response regulator [Treponema sp.]